MYLLNKQIIQQQLTMTMAISAITDLLLTQTKHPDWIKTPDRLVIPTFANTEKHTTGSHLSMPCVVFDGDNEYATVKLVSICPDNPKQNKPTTVATITVSNNATGQTLAFMEGGYITRVRTAALSGIATQYLALPSSETVAVVGTGGMAYEQLNAVLTVCPDIKTVNLWNRTEQTAQDFKQQFKKDYSQWDVEITVYEYIEEAIAQADIINLATRAAQGLFEVDSILPHAHINAVGAYQPKMKEISNSVLASSHAVFVDDLAGAKHEAGDLIQADKATDSDWNWDCLTGQLTDLVNGTFATEDAEHATDKLTVFKSVGAASFDAAVALKVVEIAKEKNVGQMVDDV